MRIFLTQLVQNLVFQSQFYRGNYCKRKIWKDEKTKSGGKMQTYLTHVCRLPWSLENLERIDRKEDLSVNTVAFTAVEIAARG